jgi:hypothetical protein
VAGGQRLVDDEAAGGAGGSEDYKVHVDLLLCSKTRS